MGHQIIPQAGTQSFRGEAFISALLGLATFTTAAIVPNATAQSVSVYSSAGFGVGNSLTVGTGGSQETVVITAIADGTHISAVFAQAHTTGTSITLPGFQNVPLGVVQEFNFDDTIDLKELRGPRSRMPIAVTQSGAKISGSCKFASTNAQILNVLRGAALSTVTLNGQTVTKASRKGSDNIVPCCLQLMDVDNESGAHAFFYNVIFSGLKNPMKLDDYIEWDASFVAYPEVTTGNVYDVYYPGNQTTAFALPSQYTPDAGITTTEADYTTVHNANAVPTQ